MMEKIRFTDCIELVGKSCPCYEGEKKYISTGAVAVDKIDYDKVEIVSYENKPSRANLVVEKDAIIFAKMQATKKTLLINEETEQYIYSTGFCAVKPKESIINSRCLFHLLNSNMFLEQKDKNCSGATQKAITNTGLNKIIVAIPPLEIQESIAEQLDKIQKIIDLRRLELSYLDNLVKARFVEMFGTLDNPKFNFNKSTLGELCNKITDGKHGGCSVCQGTKRYFVGAREIYNNKVNYETAQEICVDEFEKDYKRCNVEIGDFLIVNTGATIGKSAIATDIRSKHTLLQKSVALLKLKKNLLKPEFLKWCYSINERMYMVESSSAQPNLLLSKIKATEIYVPPIELQNQFAAFVKEVDKSRFIIKSMIKEGLI